MIHINWTKAVGLSGLLILGVMSSSAAQTILLGQAVDLETEALVYQERHEVRYEDDGSAVMSSQYRTPQDELFAERIVWFDPSNPQRPEYRLVDFRDQFEEGAVVLEDGTLELYVIRDEKRESVRIDPTEQSALVVDAGFNAFIIENWDALVGGETKTFDFASAARLTTVRFRLSRAGTTRLEDSDELVFILEPDNWFVRMLVKPIRLTYDVKERALREYQGLSNIRRAGGGNHLVSIRFPKELPTS